MASVERAGSSGYYLRVVGCMLQRSFVSLQPMVSSAPIIRTFEKRALRHAVRYADLAFVDFDALDEMQLQFAFEYEVLVIRQSA